jgi:serine/threonine protein kinase
MSAAGPLSGQKLGDKYLLGELLGQGGFGVVYKAQHLLLERPQAIKILLEQHFASPKFRERFLREARTLAALDHGNILPVHDFGIEGARAYLVMPYIAGGTLEGMLRGWSGPVGLGAILRMLEQIAAALDYAHTRNIAHLDLKPANLLIHEDGRLLLSDFGLAHLMEQGAVEGGTSLQFGTPSYMAPEHLQGHPDKRSDVYALGVILYQMLAGRVPFEGSTPAMIMIKHLNEPPAPLRTLRPDLPPALESVISKALAKDPAARHATAGQLLAEFRAAVEGQVSGPYAAARVSSIYSDPTLRVSQPSGTVPEQVVQELAELKEAVRKLSQGQGTKQYALTIQEETQPKPGQRVRLSKAGQGKAEPATIFMAFASLVFGLMAHGWAIGWIIYALVLLTQGSSYSDFFGYQSPAIFLIFSLAVGLFAFIPGIVAVDLGKRVQKQIHLSNNQLRGGRAAKIGYWLGYLVYSVLIFQLLAWPVRKVIQWLLKD